MTVTAEPWVSAASSPLQLQLARIPAAVLRALGGDEPQTAPALSSITLSPYLLSDNCLWLWRIRSEQVVAKPADADWITRIVIDTKTNTAVGAAGFHGAPDDRGMVELGYQVDPAHRRRGYARAALEILLETAKNDPRVNVVRATISPDNAASLALIEQFEFAEVGEQWDDDDGLEIIFEK
ncbi:GNAT family N-acetyltransferase [Homoserinimonas sp. A447]